ncbi:hypothetical protein Q8W71_22490 [Methylobacterium sp. NEAU 140]|nr:hypothetical protein [Methylobacterium sp. NEAU 140]MDP4025404.1 hypothetical protein [Methylobacterium sp. NEAU 140]
MRVSTVPAGDGGIVNAMPFPAGAHRARTGLMQDVRRDGFDL